MPRKKKKEDTLKSEAAEAAPTIPAPQEDTLESLEAPAEKEAQVSFPVVGIGASAGGLEAFEKFFKQMPPDSGMAFVLVQHLSSPHKSILHDLVQRLTRMKVYQVTVGVEVQPNCVYIIPPNKDMALLHGKLHLMEPGAPRGLRLPIDFFFRSLAQDQHERAICIVLSGTGSDGTLGLKAVKGEGGMAMVEEAQSAKYDGMPRSAINTGLADYVLPPEEMPLQLISYVKHVFGQGIQRVAAPLPETSNALQRIFILLRAQVGHDFSYYKQNTIHRRIERRMAVNQIGQLEHYARYLQQNPLEVETLFRELLISVTNFFRDPEAFAFLEEQIIPPLFARAIRQSVRVWVPGCSTGEEAYSIAMLLREHVDQLRQNFKIQIFATDIDSRAIDKARAGVYPDGIVADVSPERLNRFFVQDDDVYRIKKSIRDMVVFAEQNVVGDPPFSKIDLISCRNLLIYLQPELQKKALPLFHYSLRQGGILFLGNSESVGEFTDIFATLDRKWKVYQRKEVMSAQHALVDFPRPPFMDDVAVSRAVAELRRGKNISVRELAETSLLQHYTPACAIVNEKAEALYIHGRTGKYLEPAPGEASLNILTMAREGLRLELTTAMRKAIADKRQVNYANLAVKTNGDVQHVNLTVLPVLEPPNMQGLLMVLFEDVTAANAVEGSAASGEPITDKEQRIQELERELRTKEEYLQTTVEELETSNEELKSTNEELQSSNEEMQSTNEELETSKEELQSINEELITVNTELQKKMDTLSRVNNDMNNLLAGTGVGTVFLDRQLCIQRFTPAATRVINFIQSDIGRPVGHIVSNLVGYDSLVQDAQGVLDTLVFRKVEAQTQNGQWYLLRILPYRTLENVIEGVVITFVNITEQKQMQEALQESERNLNNAQRAARVGIWTWDLADDTFKWSDEMYRIFGVDQASYRPTPTGLADLAHPDDAHVMSAESLKRAASAKNYETEYRVIDQRTQEVKTIHLWGETIFDAGGTATRITGTLQDITRRVQAQEQAEYQALLLQSVADAVISTDLDFNVLGWNKAAEATYGWTRDQALGQQVNKFTRTEWPDEQEQEATRQLFEQGFWKGEIVQQRQDGARINVHTALSLIKDKDGNPIEVVAVNRKA